MKIEKFIKKNAAFIIIFLLLFGCHQSNEEQLPVEFVWDRVVCEECKMALSDHHYAAQVIDSNGKAYFFDDIGCTILWLRQHSWQDKARTWVNDYKTTEWIEAKEANWIYGDPRTPMGYGFAATFSQVENAMTYETVKKWMFIGKNLVNENRDKHLDSTK